MYCDCSISENRAKNQKTSVRENILLMKMVYRRYLNTLNIKEVGYGSSRPHLVWSEQSRSQWALDYQNLVLGSVKKVAGSDKCWCLMRSGGKIWNFLYIRWYSRFLSWMYGWQLRKTFMVHCELYHFRRALS